MLHKPNCVVALALLLGSTFSSNADLCSICKCDNDFVDCAGLNLENHFNSSFWPNANLSEANFDSNFIVHLRPFPMLPLVRLSLSHNAIAKIDDSTFHNLTKLEELDLSHNHLTSDQLTPAIFKGSYAPEQYAPMRSLKKLCLGSNSLHTLHPDIFQHLPYLESLSLDSNPFKVIDRPTTIALSSLTFLKVLDLSSMLLKGLAEHMLHTPRHLEVLNLSSNLLVEVPEGLGDTHALQHLVLDDNPIEAIMWFPELVSLRILHMSWMPKLTVIGSGSLSGLANLEEFHCSHNAKLTTVVGDAFSKRQLGQAEGETWPPIAKLYLNNNNLGYLDSHLLGRWDRVEVLDLQGNPWVCDCENQWMVSTLVPMIESKSPLLLPSVVCEEPVEMRGISLRDLDHRNYHMRCLDRLNHQPEHDGLLLIGVLIGVLLAVPVTMAAITLYKRHSRTPTHFSKAFYNRASSVEAFS